MAGIGDTRIAQNRNQAVQLGRQSRPDLEVGICGERKLGGVLLPAWGMNYVSCSAYRVPIVRLAAAQAAIPGGDRTEAMRTV